MCSLHGNHCAGPKKQSEVSEGLIFAVVLPSID